MLVTPKPQHVFFALSAIVLAALGGTSYFWPICFGRPLGEQNWLLVHFFDGRVRAFWIHGENEPIFVRQVGHRPELEVSLHRTGKRTATWNDFAIRPTEGGMPPASPWYPASTGPRRGRILIGSRCQVGPVGGAWRAPLRLQSPFMRPRTGNIRAGGGNAAAFSYLRLPIWVPVVGLLASPIMVVFRGPLRMRWRRQRGLCIHCGYDARKLPSPRCPECGRPTTPVCAVKRNT